MNKSGFKAYRENRPLKTIAQVNDNNSIKTVAYVGGAGMDAGGGSGLAPSSTLTAQPKFYSPLHTPSNWQIPTKRRESYQWTIDNKGLMLQDDLTFLEIENLIFQQVPVASYALCGSFEADGLRIQPNEIVEDDITGGVIFKDIQSEPIFGGNGHLRQPVHASQRDCENKRFIKIKANGSYHDLRLSEEHNVFILRHDEVRSQSLKHRSLRAGAKKYPNGKAKLLTMKEFYLVNPWSVRRVRADEVREKDFLLTPVPRLNKPQYQHLDHDYCWMLGQALADANIQKNHNSCTVRYNCAHNEPNTIDNVKRILTKFYGRYKERVHTESEHCQQISIYSKQAYEDACVFISGKLKNKKLTKEIRNLTEEQILHLLGGYLDGDGFFAKKDSSIGVQTTGENLANQIYFLCLIAGISCVIQKNKLTSGISGEHKVVLDDWSYSVIIPKHEIHKIAPYMRSGKIPEAVLNEPVKAHNNRFFFHDIEGNTFLAQPIDKITEFLYTGLGYDLQIDPERSFVCSGFKVSNCRFFSNNEPKVAAALDFYSQFPIRDFENVCDDIKVKKYFDDVKRRLRIVQIAKQIAYERMCIGDAFVFADIYCPKCGGVGVLPNVVDPQTGAPIPCPHENGTFTNLTVLNPDWIEVQSGYVTQDVEVIVMQPDSNLRNIVSRRAPKDIYERIPPVLRQLILQGKPIPLHPMCSSHLAYNRVPYQPYGRSIIMRLFRTLAYKDKIVQANWMIADRHILPIKVVKVGSDQYPAGPQDIAAVQSQLYSASNESNVTLIVPHAFDLDFVGASGKVLQLSKEYDMIEQEMLDGLMINKALLNGEGPNFCHSDDTEFLTNSGWKHYKDISENDTLGTFNRDNGALEYQPYINRWQFDYDSNKSGEMFHFISSKLDCLVTPNHKMLVLPRQGCKPILERGNWELIQAKDVKPRAQLRGCVESLEGKELEFQQFPAKFKRLSYLGKVVCFETPNHTLITRRNGKIIVTGNSNASVGIEAMIQRLESEREEIAEWIEEKIYRQIAIMQGFTEEDETGKLQPCYPKVKWKEMSLRDDTQRKNMMIQLNEKGKVSNQTLLEYFGLDPDVEIERMRLESIIAQELGIGGGQGDQQGGGGGGDLGGMLGGGGGGGGGMPGGDMGGGGMEAGGMSPAGGEAPEAGGGGGAPQASRPLTNNAPQAWSPVKRPMITRHPKSEKHDDEEIQPVPRIMLTKPEQLFYKMLKGAYDRGQIIHPCVPQYKACQERKFLIDFAFPTLKLGIEVEGKVWHDSKEQKMRDTERDQYLAKRGWMVWRFSEKEITNYLNERVFPQTMKLISDREKQLGVK
jgi:hypothetical protein